MKELRYTHAMEEQLRPLVEEFVADQNGRFQEFISDEVLVGFLMHSLGSCRHGSTDEVRGAVMLEEQDVNMSYEAAQWIFESVLEASVRACHGHHMAQNFNSFMNGKLGIE